MKYLKFISIFYFITLIAFFLYSFTQIDLSLTFSRIDFLRQIVKSFQYIGYFNRPLSTFFDIFFVVFLFNFYFAFLILAYTKQLRKTFVWKLLLITTVILAFSYNAFSYDLFNYIFDAKIITYYHQNPYLHKALDFPGDPMLSFMHWTHRVYPYGPIWLVLTVPLSFLGFQFFLPTFFLFKLLMAVSFLGCLYFIGKIFQKIAPEREVLGLVFFGLQPLILIESLVSAHLDIVMMFFALWALYFLLNKRYIFSFLLLFVSIGIKFATIFLLPVFIAIFVLQKIHKKISWDAIWFSSFLLMIATVVFASLRTNFQPWYLIEIFVFAVFIGYRYYIFIPSVIISAFALFTYIPYLFEGNWNNPIPQLLNTSYIVSYILSIVAVVGYYFFKKKKHSS